MSEFSWDEVYARRAVFARLVSAQINLSFSLTAGIKEAFGPLELTDQFLADQPMWRVPFYVVAKHMAGATAFWHVIDHAWWLIADDRSGEPWGFVTEPYMDPDDARKMSRTVNRLHKDWGITTKVWPQEQSPWYPGSTVPIVTTCSVGCLGAFLQAGVGKALALMTCAW